MERLECKRCGYSWVPRVDYKPKRCPGCSSKYWDKEKKNASAKRHNGSKSG